MKNLFSALILSTAFLASGFTFWTREAPLPKTPTYEETLNALSTPQLLVRWMKKNLRFVEDQKLFGTEDYWQTPQEFWNLRAGDCEDYALFAKRVLEIHGIESYVVSIYGEESYAHTVLVFKEARGYSVINEDRLYTFHTATLEETLSRVYSGWTWGSVAEEKDKRGWPVLPIQNPSQTAF